MAKNIRTSQLLTPFGIGQIINFPQEYSVMVCGLNLWDETLQNARNAGGNINEKLLKFHEDRLQNYLGVKYFMKPFEYKKKGESNNHLFIPAVRFPKWHHCTNPKCGRMKEVELTFSDAKVECNACSGENSRMKFKMIPLRFVAVCSEGHIQDVPFKEWVHDGPIPNNENTHFLSYHSFSGSGDLGSISLKCSCGASKRLSGLMNVYKDNDVIYNSALASIGLEKGEADNFSGDNPNSSNPSGQYCRGHRPWLGTEGISNAVNCKKHLQVLIRGGSNVHYSNIISALYLPKTNSNINEYILKIIDRITLAKLKEYYLQDMGKVFLPLILGTQPEVSDNLVSKEEVFKAVIDEINNYEEEKESCFSEEELRQEEYEYILSGHEAENSDFKGLVKSFDKYRDKEFLDYYFDSVVLIEKLKETRVFTGFSRIKPTSNTDMNELSNSKIEWLPAVQVFGEGIFLRFNDKKIKKWLNEYGDYFEGITRRHSDAMLKRKPDEEPEHKNGAFILLHTFAHLLIKKLCFNCGYGSSSLREKIYYSDSPDWRMNGILIYTSSGDSEGSLGGLVRQGKSENLGKMVKEAIEDAKWCSADPVCSDVGQSSGQGPDNVNGSACHNCCILPETSCEEFNTLLDRVALVGTIENPSIGYFSED